MKSLVLKNTLLLCLLVVGLNAQNAVKTTLDSTALTPHPQDALPPVAGMPIMTFDKKTVNFGKIKAGAKPEVIYNFTNTGDTDLDILIVSSCDCTDLEWTSTTVKPGGKGMIRAVFYSEDIEPKDRKKPKKKPIDVILKQNHPVNDYPIVEELSFEAIIID